MYYYRVLILMEVDKYKVYKLYTNINSHLHNILSVYYFIYNLLISFKITILQLHLLTNCF